MPMFEGKVEIVSVSIIDAALDAALDAAQVAEICTRGHCHQRGAWQGVDR